LTKGANASIAIGAGGGAAAAGGDTTFNSSAIVAKGGSTTTTSTGGGGGSSGSGTGATKYSGGSGGNGGNSTSTGNGGGGGAGGSTANGSNGGNNSTATGGAGGAGGATGGAASVAGGTDAALSGNIGYDNGSSAAGLGTNYAGGGGAGGGYQGGKGGAGMQNGGVGAAPGGGGGGGYTGGAGSQGCIIVTWTWQSVLPASGQISMSEVAVAVKKTTSGINLNDSDVRTAFGVSSGAISLSNGYSDYRKTSVVTYINSTNTGTNPVSLLSGGSNYGSWVEGDIALAFVQGGNTSKPTQDNGPGWKYLSSVTSSTGSYVLSCFYRVLHQGDSNFYHTQAYGGCHILILRGPSVATSVGTFNSTGTTGTFTGITKASNSKTLVSFVCDRDPSASGITVPTGWTESGAASWTYFYAKSGIVDSASYTNSTNIQWTGFVNGYYQTGILLELT
jgi:hypothetical protein